MPSARVPSDEVGGARVGGILPQIGVPEAPVDDGTYVRSDGARSPVNVADANGLFEQSAPSTTWNITHVLGKFPDVTLVRSDGALIRGGIDYVSLSEIQVTFGEPVAGFASLN